MTKAQVLTKIEAAVQAAGTAQALAEAWDISQSYLSDVRAGKREPGPAILARLGLSATVQYQIGGTAFPRVGFVGGDKGPPKERTSGR